MSNFENETNELILELTKIMDKIGIAKQLKNSREIKQLNKKLKDKRKKLNDLQSEKILEQLYQAKNNSLQQPLLPE